MKERMMMSENLRVKCVCKNEEYGFFEAPFGFMFPVESIKELIVETEDGNQYNFELRNDSIGLISCTHKYICEGCNGEHFGEDSPRYCYTCITKALRGHGHSESTITNGLGGLAKAWK